MNAKSFRKLFSFDFLQNAESAPKKRVEASRLFRSAGSFARSLFCALLFVFILGAGNFPVSAASQGKIFLYGEQHAADKILEKELELWTEYYDGGMRHLFVELPYYTAEFLNLWMKADGDEILEEIYADTEGTDANAPNFLTFYKGIKEQCPETVFHGTDVGHQYDTIGARYIKYMESGRLTGTKEYKLAQENIAQGKKFYLRGGDADDVYRENKLRDNFIREFDALGGEDVMGIYGAYHTSLENEKVLAGKLYEIYGDNVSAESLVYLSKMTEPLRIDTVTVNGKDYEAAYFGEDDMTWKKGYAIREFWRLEGAYDDFREKRKNGNVLPFSNYPVMPEEGQVFVIDYVMTNGDVEREYYRADGEMFQGEETTEEFIP